MLTDLQIRKLKHRLFHGEDLHHYAVLDGASIDDLLPVFEELAPEYICLYRGELDEELAACAPYLVKLEEDSEFTDWIVAEGWSNHWGIFASSDAEMKEVRKHFRTFLIVKDPDGKQIYFRYYDPRVLRIFLPTCLPHELDQLFGPLSAYHCEDEDPGNLLSFSRRNGELKTRTIEVKDDVVV